MAYKTMAGAKGEFSLSGWTESVQKKKIHSFYTKDRAEHCSLDFSHSLA